MSDLNLTAQITELLKHLDTGSISPSAYDTAWVCRVKDKNDGSKPAFPVALAWIIEHQNEDGSWGDPIVNQPFDKAISTLSCIIALKQYHQDEAIITKALTFLNQDLPRLIDTEERLTVGFEMIFPELLKEAAKLGITLENEQVQTHFVQLREKKIAKLPLEYLYHKKTVYNYSLELLNSTAADFEQISKHLEPNGSYASSPASTAFMLTKKAESSSLAYLSSILDKFDYIPDFYPFEEFERSWIISYFFQLGLVEEFRELLLPHVKFLENSWSDSGVAFSKYFGVVDLDITSTIYKILNHFDYKHSVNVFKNFENEAGFFCYFGESESSISHMANFVDCLETSQVVQDENAERERLLTKAMQFINGGLLDNLNDKWNTSIYYTYSRITFFGKSQFADFTNGTKKYILLSQNTNGSWGKNNGDPEETCWAVIALAKISGEHEFANNPQIAKAYTYLSENNINSDVRSNWISKVLYSPLNIRNTLILLTLYKLDRIFKAKHN